MPEGLILYDRMRLSIEQCAQIDDATEIRDKAQALAYYARQRDDNALDVWMSEIRLRAVIRIGELSRELEKNIPGGPDGGSTLPPVGKSKGQALAEAGLSTTTANRYEELTAYNEETKPIFVAATEKYLAESNQNGHAPTFGGIKNAIRDALIASGMKLPKTNKAKRKEEPEADHRYIDFIGPIHDLAERQKDFDPKYLASQVIPQLASDDLGACQVALNRIKTFVELVKKRFPNAHVQRTRKSA